MCCGLGYIILSFKTKKPHLNLGSPDLVAQQTFHGDRPLSVLARLRPVILYWLLILQVTPYKANNITDNH